MTSRKKPGAAFWATVVVVGALVAYPLSFGPACWLTAWGGLRSDWLFVVYAPCTWILNNGPDGLHFALMWYSLVGAPHGCGWIVDDVTFTFIRFGRL